MRDNYSAMEIEEMIRACVKTTEAPAAELNNKLKAALYQQEAALRRQPATHTLSLWYLPMILNLVTFCLLAVFAFTIIENACLSYLAAGFCLYAGMAGILITIIGVKRTNIKEDITIRIEKRGVLA